MNTHSDIYIYGGTEVTYVCFYLSFYICFVLHSIEFDVDSMWFESCLITGSHGMTLVLLSKNTTKVE